MYAVYSPYFGKDWLARQLKFIHELSTTRLLTNRYAELLIKKGPGYGKDNTVPGVIQDMLIAFSE